VIQQIGTNIIMVIICRQLGYLNLSISRTTLLGLVSIWAERVYYQWFCYRNSYRAEEHPNRVFFTHWGPSADTGHWLLQLERIRFHVFKRDGTVKAELEHPRPDATPKEIPPLSKALYIPFCQYVRCIHDLSSS
jgi:hypothetical protein